MWVLEGPKDDQRWLRPGSEYVVGRLSKTAPVSIPLNEASVSRRHLVIHVGSVVPGSHSHLSIRSSLRIEDLNSRFGTQVNGSKIEPGGPVDVHLVNNVAVIAVGNRTELVIRWLPMVISFSTGERDQAHSVMWAATENYVENLDIKLVKELGDDVTMFMTASKHTHKLLYALAKNLTIVSPRYAEALASAADDMEKSFRNLPDPKFFLPDQSWAPNPARQTCLLGQKFVFVQQEQYEALRDALRLCGGKTELLKDVEALRQVTTLPSLTTALVKSSEPTLQTRAQELASVATIEPVDLVTAISNAKPVNIPLAAQPRAPRVRARPARADMLGFMSQDPVKPEEKAVNDVKVESVRPEAQNPSQMETQNQSQSQSQSQIHSGSQADTGRPRARQRVQRMANVIFEEVLPSEPSQTSIEVHGTPREPAEESEPTPPQVKATKRRAGEISGAADLESAPDSGPKSRRRVQSPDLEMIVSEDEDGDEDPSEPAENPQDPQPNALEIDVDIGSLRDLAIVENTLTLRQPRQVHQTEEARWAGRPNYKAFKRKTPLPQKPRAPLVGAEHILSPEPADFGMFDAARGGSASNTSTASRVGNDSESMQSFLDAPANDESDGSTYGNVSFARSGSEPRPDSDDEFGFQFS